MVTAIGVKPDERSSDSSWLERRMSDITILVIDDDASIHRAVERRLDGIVDRVLKADSPTAGIRIAIQDQPDAILLDVNMPQIDGFKVCRNLQENIWRTAEISTSRNHDLHGFARGDRLDRSHCQC